MSKIREDGGQVFGRLEGGWWCRKRRCSVETWFLSRIYSLPEDKLGYKNYFYLKCAFLLKYTKSVSLLLLLK